LLDGFHVVGRARRILAVAEFHTATFKGNFELLNLTRKS